jgi:putative acyl-CoA dehydrogenase
VHQRVVGRVELDLVDPPPAAACPPRAPAPAYDAASRPAAEHPGATIGMAMTDKQGGSDVRA